MIIITSPSSPRSNPLSQHLLLIRSFNICVYNDYNYIRDTHLPERVAFVIMKSALHAHDRYTLQMAENHLTGVTLYRRYREMWDFLVREALLVHERFRDRTWTQLVLLIWSCLGINKAVIGRPHRRCPANRSWLLKATWTAFVLQYYYFLCNFQNIIKWCALSKQ